MVTSRPVTPPVCKTVYLTDAIPGIKKLTREYGGDPIDARGAFDKALLLDTGTKDEISRTCFEAAQGVAEKKGDAASAVLISAYLEVLRKPRR